MLNQPYSCMRGSVALITGAANGIGRATARRFAAEGARVMLADLDANHLAEAVAQIKKDGGEARSIVTDVSNGAAVKAMILATVDAYGRLDYAFNNAGIEQDPAPNLSIERREASWDRVMAVNMKGVWLCMEYEIEQFLAQGGPGAIVNTASTAGFKAVPGHDIYTASKHGVVGLTRGTAVAQASAGIRVNAVAPGGTKTAMVQRALDLLPPNEVAEVQLKINALHPLGRMGEPEEVAAAVVWLCSTQASFVTGHVLAVDGGWLAW